VSWQRAAVTYRNEDVNDSERIAAKDKVYENRQNHSGVYAADGDGTLFESRGLEDGYKVLADFNGTVLAGSRETRHPVRHLGLGLWTHGRMPWALLYGEL
jgi:hypothetical protein